MPGKEKFKEIKKQRFKVQCTEDKAHVFETELTVELDLNNQQIESEVQAHCPKCSTMVSFTIKGTPVADTSIITE